MSTEPSHNSIAAIWRLNDKSRKVEYLVMDSTTTHPDYPNEVQVKFAGGGNEGDETAEETCRREVREETGLRVRGKTPVHQVYSRGNGHKKYGFAICRKGCRGSLRKKPLDEKDSILGPPYWLEASEALAVIHRHPKNESHFHTGLNAAERIAKELGIPLESVLD